MDDVMIEERLDNLDHRLSNVEQILQRDISPRLENVEQILPTLATKVELRHEIDGVKRHMTILFEDQDDKIQLLAEHLLAIRTKLNA